MREADQAQESFTPGDGNGGEPPKTVVGTIPEGSSEKIERIITLMREMTLFELRDLRDKIYELTGVNL